MTPWNPTLEELASLKLALDQAATVMVTDARGVIVSVNDAYCRLSGYTRDELIGQRPSLVGSGHHPPEFFTDMHETLASGRIWRGEIRNRTRDGRSYWVHSTIVPSLDADGRPERFTEFLYDVTERVLAEKAVRDSEARMRQIVDTAIDAVITIDETGRIIGWTRQAEQVFGWTAEEAAGKSLTETIVPLQYRAAHTRGLARFLSTGERNVLGQRIEITALRRSGEEFPVELSISALTLEGTTHFSAFARDISDRKRVESELVCARDAAQQASRAKSDFLATMSHEIRTPMNGVIGFTELLMDTPLDTTQLEYAETIRSSGHALLALINDILDFSKIEAGKLDIERVPFDARRAAGEVAELLSARAEERGLEVVFEWPEELPSQLLGDPMRFRQVLLNLTANAVKFTESGCVHVQAGRDAQGQLRVEVRDTGIGIAADKLAMLFRKFTQADSSTTRRFGGSGLGLAISKQLVELMGGAIGAESRCGEGSAFWFTQPLPSPALALVPAAPAAGCAGLRVLVVDDLEPGRRVLCSQLSLRGIDAVPAATAAEARELLRSAAGSGKPFRAVLLDLGLLEVDGEELGREILALPGDAAPAVVLMTSASRRPEADRFRSLGFAEVLYKPVVRPELLVQALTNATRSALGARDDATRGPVPRAAGGAPEPGAAPAFAGTRVLLAEDTPVNQKLALRMLGKLGCTVDLADNGTQALSLASANPYDLILMDCHMPEMDGYEATVAIRAREAADVTAGSPGRQVPIVALTASVLKEDRERCFASGMDDFISKPFRAEQLFTALERWTRRDRESAAPLREAA